MPFKISEKLITSANVQGIQNHFSNLSNRYNYSIIPAWNWLNWIANWHLLMDRYKEAINLYGMAAKYYPYSSKVYFKLANAQLKGKMAFEANKNLELALQYAKDNDEKEMIKAVISRLKQEK